MHISGVLIVGRLFLLLVVKLSEMPMLSSIQGKESKEKMEVESVRLGEDDDLDLCLYYLLTLDRVLGCTGEPTRAVLASKYLYIGGGQVQVRGSSPRSML